MGNEKGYPFWSFPLEKTKKGTLFGLFPWKRPSCSVNIFGDCWPGYAAAFFLSFLVSGIFRQPIVEVLK